MNESTPLIDDLAPTPPHPTRFALPTMTPDQQVTWLTAFTNALAHATESTFGLCLERCLIPAIADAYSLEVMLPDGSIRTHSAAHGVSPLPTTPDDAALGRRRAATILAAIAQVIHSGQPLFNRLHSMLVGPSLSEPTTLTFDHGAIVPLLIQGEAIGALSIGSMRAEWPYLADDGGFLGEIAARIAFALDNQRLRRQLADAVEARDATLVIVAHELRTPLAALITQMQLLRRRMQDIELHDERTLQGLALLDQQARRLNLLVDALFDATQLNHQPRRFAHERFDLGRTIQRVHDSFAGVLINHSLHLDLCADAVLIDGDALRIEQALQNLLHNAVKYSPHGGAIELCLERHDAHARIIISDEGIGIPVADRDRIFERFYRAKNAVSHGINGVGIGLYIVHAIIALHNGTIQVAETPEAGATFIVELPLADTQRRSPNQTS